MGSGRQRGREVHRFRGVEHDSQILDENADRGQRRVVAFENMRHAVLEHPGRTGTVGDDFIQRARISTAANAQCDRLACRGDVHAGKQLIDHLDF